MDATGSTQNQNAVTADFSVDGHGFFILLSIIMDYY